MEEAKRLIRFNTQTWKSDADCAVHVGGLLRRVGAKVFYQEEKAGDELFLNVVGLLGSGKSPILLTTHLDTVEAGDHRLWTKTGGDPWRLSALGGFLYGLGAADAKLDLLCKLSAIASLPAGLQRPLILVGTYGEESGLRGAARFCQGDFPKPGMALIGEPSGLSLVTRHKSLLVVQVILKEKGISRPTAKEWAYDVAFEGKAAHSSVPAEGQNALAASFHFMKNLAKKEKKVNLFSWQGGVAANVIPAASALSFSLGPGPKKEISGKGFRAKVRNVAPGWYPTLPWRGLLFAEETVEKLLAPYEKEKDKAFVPPHMTWGVTHLVELPGEWVATFDIRGLPRQGTRRFVKQLEATLWKEWGAPGVSWQLRVERDNPALDTEKSESVVKWCGSALRAARLPVGLTAKSGCSEAGLYAKLGIPSVVIGPGCAAGNIHQPNERVALSQLKSAIRFYKAFLEKRCF